MREILHVLFGAGFTVTVATAIGWLLLRRLRVKLDALELALFAFLCGAGCLSLIVFLLCLAQQARKGVFLWGGAAVAAWCCTRLRLPKRWPRWNWRTAAAFSIFIPFFIVYFVNALAPERSPDGSGYHLGNVLRIWQHHGFVWDYHSMYAHLSQGFEMLFLVAFSFGAHPAAAIVHLAFQTVLPVLIVCYGRRFGLRRVAWFAAVLVYTAPVVGLDGASAYNDLAVASVLFALFYLLQVWDENRERNLLILIGLLAGFAYAIKYTAFLALPFAIGFVVWKMRQWRHAAAICAAASVLIAPWVMRNWLWLGNPAAPFLNRWFPNPYYHPADEIAYFETLRRYEGLAHWWQVPLQLTVQGGIVDGLIGPVFLLAPFALLAWRNVQGRWLLIAAAVFGIPGLLNTGARFLIPALPFAALAMGIGLARPRGVLPALALFQAIACWPAVLTRYCDPWTWRISSVPVSAALRKEPAARFIEGRIGDYVLKDLIEREVSPADKIFSFAGRPEAYINREIVVGYESALGSRAEDALWSVGARRPNHRQRFRFLPLRALGVRAVQTARAKPAWAVTEMRILSGGRELPRSPAWRLSGWPNGREVQLAFDNSYATRWSTAEPMRPRNRLQVEFGSEQAFDEVLVEGIQIFEAHVQVEVRTADGRWVPITDSAEESAFDPPTGIRRAAAAELRALGIRYLWINDGDFVADDMKKYAKFWGITQLAETNGARFYRID